MTRLEKFRSLSDEEIVKLIFDDCILMDRICMGQMKTCTYENEPPEEACIECVKRWLMQEAKEDT